MKMTPFLLLLCSIPSMVFAAGTRDIAIAEVFFDPVSTDTGLEYVVIKNLGADTIDLSGWSVYLDDAGYYPFASTSLNSGQSITIHLRKSGINSSFDLYFSDAPASLRNFSGSIALFSGTNRSTSTIVSYVHYNKPGSVEHKTWESLAAGAGIWTKGDFVNIGSGAEGKILRLIDVSRRFSSAGWALVDAPKIAPKIITATTTKTTAKPTSKMSRLTNEKSLKTESFYSSSSAIKQSIVTFRYFLLIVGIISGALAGCAALLIKKYFR